MFPVDLMRLNEVVNPLILYAFFFLSYLESAVRKQDV